MKLNCALQQNSIANVAYGLILGSRRPSEGCLLCPQKRKSKSAGESFQVWANLVTGFPGVDECRGFPQSVLLPEANEYFYLVGDRRPRSGGDEACHSLLSGPV
jgi:hypothetical protein